tara:strand:- start:3297 stop:4145 length:849 start_codon:yes stop_codon:yes gene_type:complete
MANKAKPDFLDMDKDGNKKEPMKKAVADKKKKPVGETAEINPKHKAIAAMGRKMIDMSSSMTGTDDKTLMVANAMSRLGDTLVNFGANFGPKNMNDVVRITGMKPEVIQMLISKVKQPAPAESVSEGLGDMAHMAEQDHEVQMARADLYKTAKYAIKLHDMLKGVSEAQGIEGWMQAKITKAADYIGSVYHTLEYDMIGANESKKVFKSTMTEADKTAYKSQLAEKAKSKSQQKFMGMVHAAQKGENPASKEVAKVAKEMPKKAAKDYAATKHKGKPEHVKK